MHTIGLKNTLKLFIFLKQEKEEESKTRSKNKTQKESPKGHEKATRRQLQKDCWDKENI